MKEEGSKEEIETKRGGRESRGGREKMAEEE